jgi:hypothetical protein
MNVLLLYHKCASQWTLNVFRQLAGIKNEFLYMGNREPEKINGVFQNEIDNHPTLHNKKIYITDPKFPGVGIWENINVKDEKFKSLFPPISNTVTIIRDPRDILISGYYSHKKSHPVIEGLWKDLPVQRSVLLKLNKEEGLLSTIDFLSYQFNNLKHLYKSKVTFFLFEDVVYNPYQIVKNILNVWDIKATNKNIKKVVDKYTLENLKSGKVKTPPFNSDHYRSGRPGEWKDVLSVKVLNKFYKKYPNLIDEYEKIKSK